MRKPSIFLPGMCLLLLVPPSHAQVRVIEAGTSGEVNVRYDHPDDKDMAVRLRDMVFRVKRVSDVLHPVEKVDLTVVHTQRELDLQLGPDLAGAMAGASYLRGILCLSPLMWNRNPTDEAIEAEMERAMVRYAMLQLTGGHRVAPWLEDGLEAYLTKQQFAATTAEQVAARAEMLLISRTPQDPSVGYWAVRYLVEQRGGIGVIQRLLYLTARRPDTFFENFELSYTNSIGDVEREWRAWLTALAEEDRRQREGGVRRADPGSQ